MTANLTEEAMLDGLRDHVAERLRVRFQIVADEVIDLAIEDAMKTFEASIQSYANFAERTEIIEVLLHDRRKLKDA